MKMNASWSLFLNIMNVGVHATHWDLSRPYHVLLNARRRLVIRLIGHCFRVATNREGKSRWPRSAAMCRLFSVLAYLLGAVSHVNAF